MDDFVLILIHRLQKGQIRPDHSFAQDRLLLLLSLPFLSFDACAAHVVEALLVREADIGLLALGDFASDPLRR